jgi:TetR/AcrR family transcriptional regulator, transcriptional repressor for nem operon
LREVLVDEIVLDGSRQACPIVSAATERPRHDTEVAQRVRATTQSLEDGLRDVIAAGQVDGELPDRQGPRDLARFLVMATHGPRSPGGSIPTGACCWPLWRPRCAVQTETPLLGRRV